MSSWLTARAAAGTTSWGTKKHDISVSGETLLERTVRLVHKFDDAAEIIITSHDESVSIPGAVRYEPKKQRP